MPEVIHECKICGLQEECLDEIPETMGTCDFRTQYNAHGYCVEKLTLKERIAFYGDKDIYIVERSECTHCGDGFASNTFCKVCVDNAKISTFERRNS